MRNTTLLALLSLLVPAALCGQLAPVEITFLDVGQGDAILVRAPEGQTALIDAGPGGNVVGALRDLGVERLDLVVATHPHADHIGGLLQVLRAMPVGYYMDNGQPHTTAAYLSLMKELQSRPDIGYLQTFRRTIQLGSVSIEVLPLPPYPDPNFNNNSVGLVVGHGEFRAFLSGDSERAELAHFIDSRVVPDVTLLKAPHHGSDDATLDEFLMIAQPEVVVISVGSTNTYGHPSPDALFTYDRYARERYRTDQDGQVTVHGFDDGTYRVSLRPTGQGVRDDLLAADPRPTERRGPVPSTDGSPVSIRIEADAPGDDAQNLNGEYAVLTNGTRQPIEIVGWRLCDEASQCFTFPAGSTIESGAYVILYSGRGLDGGARYFMGSRRPVWNDDGDTATLYDADGFEVASHGY